MDLEAAGTAGAENEDMMPERDDSVATFSKHTGMSGH